MKSFVYVGSLLLVLGSMTMAQGATLARGEAVIQHLSGSVRITDANGITVRAAPNLTLEQGWSISTGTQSSVDLLLRHNGATLGLASDSKLVLSRLEVDQELTSWTTTTVLNLQAGEMLGKATRQMPGSTFTVRTPQAYLEIVGTEFFVNAQQGDVHVTEGTLAVNLILNLSDGSTAMRTVNVGAGQSLLIPTNLRSAADLDALLAVATSPSLSAEKLAWMAQHTPRFEQYTGTEVNVTFQAKLNRNGSIVVFKAPTVTVVSP